MEDITGNLPLHVQYLRALRTKVERRKRELERRCGKGLEDQEYQRHVGRIAECELQLETVNDMIRADIDDIADAQEVEDSELERSQTRASKHRRRGTNGQRGVNGGRAAP